MSSHSKENTFNKLLDYFAEDEDDNEEEEFINYEEENNYFYYSNPKNLNYIRNGKNKDINNLPFNKQNQIFTELYSNVENNDDNVFHYEERKLPINEIKGEEFNNFKFASFRPYEPNKDDKNNEINTNIKEDEKENQNKNEKIIEKVNTNNWLINSNNENKEKNESQPKNEMMYNKIIASQCSFGNINETSNRSTSINTDKLGEFHQSTFFQDNLDQEIYKPEYLINSKSFEKLENTGNNNNSNIIDTNTYTFKQNEKDWLNKKELVKNNIDQLKQYMVQLNQNYNSKSKSKSKSKDNKKKIVSKNINLKNNTINNNNKRPIELVLYDDAIKKKEKKENLYKNNLTEIKLNSTKTKINKKSYQIALEHDEKKIESIIKKYSKNKKEGLEIIDIALIFQELKIFRKLLQNININKLVNINNISEFKNKISITIKEADNRKIEELNFLESTWNVLNPEQKKYIRKDIFEGLLKIIYSPVGNINYISNILKQYLQAALFGEGIEPLNDKNRKDNNLKIKNYIKIFFKLKENIIAYKNINNYNGRKYETIINDKNKNLTFEPNIAKNKNYNTMINERKKNFNFNTLYNRFIQKEKNKEETLDKLKQNKLKEELKELKQKPTINKVLDNNSDYSIHQNIHDKLYKMDMNLRKKRQKKIDEKKKEEQEKIEKELKSFKLNVNSRESRRRMAKSFDNKIKPKGYDDYIKRNKKAILEKNRIKTIKEKIPNGENYEKIKRRSITPFNITDLRKRNKKKINENGEFFTLQIKIPNGQLRTLKIFINNDPYKVADDFCKIYSIKESIKKKLIKNIIHCQEAYLNNKNNLEMEEEEELAEDRGEIYNNKVKNEYYDENTLDIN